MGFTNKQVYLWIVKLFIYFFEKIIAVQVRVGHGGRLGNVIKCLKGD